MCHSLRRRDGTCGTRGRLDPVEKGNECAREIPREEDFSCRGTVKIRKGPGRRAGPDGQRALADLEQHRFFIGQHGQMGRLAGLGRELFKQRFGKACEVNAIHSPHPQIDKGRAERVNMIAIGFKHAFPDQRKGDAHDRRPRHA